MKIGYIHSNIIGHWRFKECIKILCEKTNSDFVISSLHKSHKDYLDKYRECDLIIDENRLYSRQRSDQKIVYWYTGAGDLSSHVRHERQFCNNLDYIITPLPRAIRNNKRYDKYKPIGNPASLYFENNLESVKSGPHDCVLVPEEKCFDMNVIMRAAEDIAKREGLNILYKKRDNSEDISECFEYFKKAKYIVTGFSSMAFEGLYFGIKFVMIRGLQPSNGMNNDQLFYRELRNDYGGNFVSSYDEFRYAIENVNYDSIYNEHYNKNFIEDFMALVTQ